MGRSIEVPFVYPHSFRRLTPAGLRVSDFDEPRPVVHWIDDENEARELGVSVDDLHTARKIAAKMSSGNIESIR